MNENLSVINTLISLGGLATGIIGFVFVIYQIRQLGRSVRSAAHTAVYAQAANLREMIIAYPETRKYLLGGQPLEDGSPDTDRVVTIAESFLNYLEQLAVQKGNLGNDNWKSWRQFIENAALKSPVLMDLYKANRNNYSPALRQVLDRQG